MTDTNKPSTHLPELLELLESKKRQCWEQARFAKVRGEVYEECASELRYALEKEAGSQSNG